MDEYTIRQSARYSPMTGKFPLPPNFFRCPPLTHDEHDYMTSLGRKSLIDLVRHSRIEGGPIKWSLDSDESGLQIYSGEDPTAPSEMIFYCSTTEVMATIDEAASLFRLETTELFREYCSMFAKDLLDAASLYTLAMPTEQHPRHYIGVKWTCLESPSSLIKNRDWCYLECQDDFEMNGQRGWARSLSSIKLPCCPDLQNSLGIIRASFYRTGYVFLETERPGYLQVIHAIQVDLKGNVPGWVVNIGMKKRARSISEIDKFLRERRLSRENFLLDHELVPKSSRSKCFVCHKKFGAFTKKHNCRRCGEVVCRSCSKYWNVDMNSHRVNLRICSACSIGTFNKIHQALTSFNDASSIASNDQCNSAFAPVTPRKHQEKLEHQSHLCMQPRDNIEVKNHTALQPPIHGPTQKALPPSMPPTVQEAPSEDSRRQGHQQEYTGYQYQRDYTHNHPPPYKDEYAPPPSRDYPRSRDGSYSASQHDYGYPEVRYDRDVDERSNQSYAPLNAKNLEAFTQRQGPPKPVPFTAQPIEPIVPDIPHSNDGNPHRRGRPEDRYYDPREDPRYYDYDRRGPPARYDSRYDLQYENDYRYGPPRHTGDHYELDRRYHDEYRYEGDRVRADDGYYRGGRREYDDEGRRFPPRHEDGSGVSYENRRPSRSHDDDGTSSRDDGYSTRSHDAYIRGRYDDDRQGYNYPGGRAYNDNRYNGRDQYDDDRSDRHRYIEEPRRYESSRDSRESRERRYEGHEAPIETASRTESTGSKDADMAGIFKQMEALGLKPVEGQSSQQQLLALYKHLQQMNLESTPPKPES